MNLLQRIADFLKAIFVPSSPENLQRQSVRKIELELKTIAPSLYKNGLIQVDFAEALRILYKNTSPILDILSETYCSTDSDISVRYEEQLLLTGFDSEAREIFDSLSYENRKKGAKEAQSMLRYFEAEHQQLEIIKKELTTAQNFAKIDEVLNKIKQLDDICKFNYTPVLKLFDENYSSKEGYVPNYQPVPIELLENCLEDLYFVTRNMNVTNALYNAVIALYKLKNGGNISDKTSQSLKENYKKIQAIIKHIFTKEILENLIRLAKKNLDFIPKFAAYNGNAREKYANFLEEKFRIDESRLKSEIQDETISSEINQIFSGATLSPVHGYSKDLDYQLKQTTPCSFIWITPLYILKNFIKEYFELHIRNLFNDIVIEGFFNNPTYKSDFSAAVFACNESLDRIKAFETKFTRGNEFDEANITSLIRDSHKDAAFGATLKKLIDKINKQAKDLIQAETTNIFRLYKKIKDVLIESKKPNSEVITNLKVLMFSSRNRENADFLESQNPQWKIFLEIMKNYVIIGSLEEK